MKKKKLLFFLYNRWYDPLLQSNIILFINELAILKNTDIAIITFEDPKNLMSNDELQSLKINLKSDLQHKIAEEQDEPLKAKDLSIKVQQDLYYR